MVDQPTRVQMELEMKTTFRYLEDEIEEVKGCLGRAGPNDAVNWQKILFKLDETVLVGTEDDSQQNAENRDGNL